MKQIHWLFFSSLFAVSTPSIAQNEPLFFLGGIAKCEKWEESTWGCLPQSANITLEDGYDIREVNPEIAHCKDGVCKTEDGVEMGHSTREGKYYLINGWQIIQNGEYAAYSTKLPVTDTESLADYTYPSLKHSIPDSRYFVPWGWNVLAHARGHIDDDGLEDWVLILKGDDVRYKIESKDDTVKPQDVNPRMIVIFKSDGKDRFRKLVQNNSFIPVPLDPMMLEPFESVAIKNGIIELNFTNEMMMGSWSSSNDTFKFVYLNDGIVLQEYTYSEVTRNTGETKTIRVDYVSGMKETKVGNIESDKSELTTQPIAFNVPLHLNSIFTEATAFYSMYSSFF